LRGKSDGGTHGRLKGEFMQVKAKGSKELLSEVIDAGLCAMCGACAGSCPYLRSFEGRIVRMDECTLSESGRCYQYCPRTRTDMDAVSQGTFGVPYAGDELGVVREVFMARSADDAIRERGQYGGVVTTLLSLAMSEGLIDAAVVTEGETGQMPTAKVARTAAEIVECAGSSYMACPVLETLNRIPEDNQEKLGIVATPCQVLALGKMKADHPQRRPAIDSTKLVLGLFCTWALSPTEFHRFLQTNLNLPEVRKFDIPPPPANTFEAYTASGKAQFSLDQVREFTMPTCAYCLDMTAEFADVSVGSVEGTEGWNTVIVRSKAGADLVEMARAKGALETDVLAEANLAHLKEAALLKKTRALRAITDKTGDKSDLLYLGLSTEVAKKLLGQGGGQKTEVS